MSHESLPPLVQRVKEDAERIAELFAEFDITDTDVLKHTLEDEQRWSREAPANSIERDRLAAALAASQRETQELKDENEKLAADWHQASMQACRDNETIMRLRRVLIGEGIEALLVSSDEMPAIVEKLRRETQEAREVARRAFSCLMSTWDTQAINDYVESPSDQSVIASWPPTDTGESK